MPKNKKLCPSEQHVEMITFCACTRKEMMENVDATRARIHSLGACIICSACSRRLTDKNISIPFLNFFLSSSFASVCCFFIVAQLTKMHSFLAFGIHLANVLLPSQINTFHAIYLLTWMVFFVKQILDMLLYIVYFLLVFFCGSFLSPSLRQSFLDIYLYQIGTGSSDTYDEISYNELNQST